MKTFFWCWLLALIFGGVAQAGGPQPASLAFVHATTIDMTGHAPLPDTTVIVQGNHIVAVGPSSGTPLPKNARVVDARGKYLIPGLWDMHTHSGANRTFYSLYIANGITGVRDMGEELKSFQAFERARRQGLPLNGKWPGPRIVAAGVIVDGSPPMRPMNLVVTDADQARQAVDRLKEDGVDFIKVYNMLSRPAYFAIAAQARKDGLAFVGHVPYAVSDAEASDAGQRSIEHSDGILLATSTSESALREPFLEQVKSGFSPAMNKAHNAMEAAAIDTYSPQKADNLFARFVRNGTWVCPTLVVQKRFILDEKSPQAVELGDRYVPQLARGWEQSERNWTHTPEEAATARKRYSSYRLLVDTMQSAGVGLLAGTDTPNRYVVPGFSLHEELSLLVDAGLTPLQAMQAATRNAARFLNKPQLGTIETGKLADLVLLDANPLTDIHNTSRIDAVMADGRFLSKEDLRKMLEQVVTPAHAHSGG